MGGRPGIHSSEAIEASIARPYCGYFRRVHQKAAVITHGFATSHGFIDGNKRTAFILAHTFLEKSGYRLAPAQIDRGDLGAALEEVILRAVNHDMTLDDLVAWFDERITR